MKKKNLLHRVLTNREIMSYLVFGVLTTVVNYIVYFACTRLFHIDYLVSNGLAWILAVLFAFVTNRRWVFQSEAEGFSEVFVEGVRFFGGRVASLILDMAIMYVGISLMGLGDYDFWVKTVSQVAVIVSNYAISKFFVFRK